MSSRGTKYYTIDKRLIYPGLVLEFTIFSAVGDEVKVHYFKDKGRLITQADVEVIKKVDQLYTKAEEATDYKSYINTHVNRLLDDPHSSFLDRSTFVYNKASLVVADLFNDPFVSEIPQKVKEVVSDVLRCILDQQFKLAGFMSASSRKYDTTTHSLHVSVYAMSLGSFLGWQRWRLEEIGEAALLHDLGKREVDSRILNKQDQLTQSEFDAMKLHPQSGDDLAQKIGIENPKILAAIRHHHEKMNGTGYPAALSGEEIPLMARVIGLCDIFDALTTRRPYKDAVKTFDALKLMKHEMSEHIDTKLLQKMVLMFR